MTGKQYDIAVLGELLIDFTPVGVSEKGNPIFERNPGGGPANMACAAARMGAKPYFIGKVGDDPFGRALKKTLEDQGVMPAAFCWTGRPPPRWPLSIWTKRGSAPSAFTAAAAQTPCCARRKRTPVFWTAAVFSSAAR